jgi:hypothetical protein
MTTLFKGRNSQYVVVLASYFMIALFIFNKISLSPGTVGFFHDWPIGPFTEMNRFYANGGMYVWNSQLGNTIYFTDWIFRLSLIPFSILDGEVLTKGLLLLIITLSGFSAFYLGKQLKLSTFSSFAAGVLFIFSPIVFTRIVAGYIYYLIAYFLTPLILTLFLKGKEENKNKINKFFIIAGLLTSFAVIQVQFLVIILIILLVFSLIDFRKLKLSFLGLIIVFSITFLIDLSPIVLSQILVKNANSYSNPLQLSISYYETLSASNLTKSFRLLGYESHPYGYTNIGTSHDPLFRFNAGVIPPWIFYLDFLLPIVGFSALIFRKDKYTLSFAVISLIGLFLLKGLNPPFPSVFSFIFVHGFYIFRELWHISFLYGFGISFLIAFFLERLLISRTTRRITTTTPSLSTSSNKPINYSAVRSSHNQQHPNRNPFYLSISSGLHSFLLFFSSLSLSSLYNGLKNYSKIIVSLILIALIVVSNGYPLLIGDFGGYLQTYNFPKDYHTLYNSLLTNNTYNTLILPLFTPIRYDGLKLEGLDPIILDSPDNIFDQYGYYLPSHPLTGISTWLHSVMQQNRTNNFGNLLSGFGIEYVVLRKDFVSNYADYVSLGRYQPFLKRWYSSLEPFLDTQKDMVVISNTPHYKIYQNTNDAKKIFVPLTVANGLSDLRDLLYISNFTSLSNVGVYPPDTNTPFYDFVGLGQFTSAFNAKEGWATNRDWFGFDYSLASRVNVGAFTMAPNTTLSFNLNLGKYQSHKPIQIWMKAFTWPKGNLVNVNINGNESSYNLNSQHDAFSLIKIFDGKRSIDPNYHFLIKNVAGQNYIEGIYIKEKDIEKDISNKNKIVMIGIQDENNLILNPDFIYVNKQSRLPLYWNDSLKNCDHLFRCNIISTDKWKGEASFQLSTNATKKYAWSWIRYNNEIDVKPGERYYFLTHMKLNEYANSSHIAMEGYNETSKKWYQISQCPSGTNGPLEWKEFRCDIAIPTNTTQIRPVLNAGWSSQQGKEAITWFDDININRLNSESRIRNVDQLKEQLPLTLKEYSELNPTLWDVQLNNVLRPFTLSFAESYDPAWEARIYKDGKKVDVVKSTPMYGAINGFQINQTGNLDIVLRYTRQDWYETGLIIAAITFAFCMFYIFYEWRRSKGDKWAEKIEMFGKEVKNKVR